MSGVNPADQGRLRFVLFGGPRVWRGDAELDAGRPHRRLLLALLVAAGGEPVTMAQIVAAVWDEDPPPTAVNIVHRLVGEVRRLLEPDLGAREPGSFVLPSGPGYRLRLAADESDVLRLRRLVADGSLEAMVEAVDLVAEPPGSVIEIEPAGPSPFAVLLEQRAYVVLRAADLAVAHGSAEDRRAVLRVLTQVAAERPYDEPLQARLIRLMAAVGRRAEALDTYAALRRRMVDELGVEPGAELRAVQREALGEQPEAGPPPPGPAAVPVPAQLPIVRVALAGREGEVAAVLAHLGGGRPAGAGSPVCAISGMAGIGKTTLAVHVAHRLADQFPDGQLFVDLRGFDPAGRVLDTDDVIRGFLSALGGSSIPAEPEARVGLYRSLTAGRRILVVLDNVRDSDHARPLLPAGEGGACIVTSRTAMSGLVFAEGAYPVPLAPLSNESAHQLLADRIGAARVDAEPIPTGRIVAACAGLPLALALVAARALRSASSPLHGIQARLADPSHALDTLSGSEASSDLREIFAASYNTLGQPAARVFRLLAVHPGTEIGLHTVASIAGIALRDARRALDELITASLVSEPRDSRYQMHDLIRIYANELLTGDERETATARLISHYVAATRKAFLTFGGEPFVALPGVADGLSLEHFPDTAAADHWYEQERQALEAVVRLALTRADVPAAAAIVLDWRRMAQASAYETAALPFITEILAAVESGDESIMTAELMRYAGDPWLAGYQDARTWLDRALTIFRKRGNVAGESRTLRNLSRLVGLQKQWADEVEFLELAIAAARSAADTNALLQALMDSIVSMSRLGRLDEAAGASSEAVRLAERANMSHYVPAVLANEAYGLAGAGQYETALDRLDKVAAARAELGVGTKLLQELFDLLTRAHVYRGLGRVEDARRAFEKALELRTTVDSFDYMSDFEGFVTEPEAIRAVLAELGPHQS
ncbi:BTAD domain-containing putative transcriptional regulator [Actinoplanes sp. NPDC000266]